MLLWMLSLGCQQLNPQYEKMPPPPSKNAQAIDQKISFLSQIIAENPPLADYHFRRAKLYFQTGRDNQAYDDIQRAIELDSTESSYFFYLAKIFELQDEPTQALVAAQTAEQKGYESPALARLLGKLHYQAQADSLALIYFEKLQRRIPNDAEAFYYRGLLAFAQVDTAFAVGQFKSAIAQKADYKEAYLQLIKLYRDYEAYPTAKRYTQAALAAVGEDDALFFEYGKILELTRKYDSAKIQYEAALRLNPTNWQATHQIGWLYFQKKDYAHAQKYLSQTLSQQPKHRASNYLMGFIFEYYRSELPQAKTYYEAALAVAPENISLQRALRRVRYKMGGQ